MGVGLRELLELPEAKQATNNDEIVKLREQFLERMGDLNRSLQLIAGQASAKDFEPLDSQRLKLYEAFQKTSTLIDKGDPTTGKESVKRMLTALESIQAKAADAAAGVSAGRDKWYSREDDFDSLVVRIGELEDAGNAKAATLRKLADSIRTRANECDYQQSVSALDQLQPKFDQIYQQHQNAAGTAKGTSYSKADALGGVFPEIVGEQLQSELKQTDSLIAQLEEAQFPKAPMYRKAFTKVRELAQGNAHREAAAGHNKLRELVDADYAKLNKSRLGGVQLPDEYDQQETKYSTGLEIPTSSQPPKSAGYPPEGLPPKPPTQYQDATRPKRGDYQDQSSAPKSSGHCTLKKGSRGPEVAQLQQNLGLTPDGDFGPKTEAAVKAFQSSKGLAADGVVGPQTWAALGSSYGPPSPPPAYPSQPPTQSPEYPSQPPKQGPAYPAQPPTQGPNYPPPPPGQKPQYPPQPPKGKPKYPSQPPDKGPAYPPQPPDQYGVKYPTQPYNEREPLAMEETGDKSQGERIQMEGVAEGDGAVATPSLGIEPGAFLNDASRVPPPPRDDPLVGQNKPIDLDDKSAGIKGTFDEILGVLGLSGVFSDVPGAKGDPAEYNPDKPTKSGKTRYGHLRPPDGPLPSDPPPVAPPAPTNIEPPPPPPLRTWGAPDPQPGDPNFIGPPAPPSVQQMVEAPAEVVDAIEGVAERLFGDE